MKSTKMSYVKYVRYNIIRQEQFLYYHANSITLSGSQFITSVGDAITLSGSYYSIRRIYYIIRQLLH